MPITVNSSAFEPNAPIPMHHGLRPRQADTTG